MGRVLENCGVSKHFKNIGVVASVTMGSRVLGLARDMLVTAVFGASGLASAFYTAFTLPNLFRRLLGEGALTAALVPTLAGQLKAGSHTNAFQLVNQVASWLFVITSGVVLTGMAMLWQIEFFAAAAKDWGVEAATAQRWVDAAVFGIVLFPYLLFVCLAAAFSAALQTLHRFLEPALSPVWLNVAMLSLLGGAVYGGWTDSSEILMLWLCGGALVGGFLQMAVPAAALMREGWRPQFDFERSEAVRRIGRLMGPTIFGSAIYLINMAVSRFVGLSLNESAVAVLNVATRLMELPIGVFAVAITTVIFPLIAKQAAAGDWAQMALSYRKGMRLILVVNVPAAIGLVVLAEPIIRLLFQNGAFGPDDTQLMRPILVIFALGLPFVSFVSLVLRAYYAQGDTKTPVTAALLSFVLNLGVSLALMNRWGTAGLAVAGNVAVAAQAWYLQHRLARKQDRLRFGHLTAALFKILVASGLMGLLVAGSWWFWSRSFPATKAWDALALALLIALGVSTYGALLWTLKIEGRDDLAAVFARLRAKFS